MIYVTKLLSDVHEFARLTHSQKSSGFLFFHQKVSTRGIGVGSIGTNGVSFTNYSSTRRITLLLQTSLGEMYFTKYIEDEADYDRCMAVINGIKHYYPLVPVESLNVPNELKMISVSMSDEYQNYDVKE